MGKRQLQPSPGSGMRWVIRIDVASREQSVQRLHGFRGRKGIDWKMGRDVGEQRLALCRAEQERLDVADADFGKAGSRLHRVMHITFGQGEIIHEVFSA